ncbi:uncharacterized protein LOC119179187 [Rhipicephalus microplus]|uniref:uncharacterized protein LOC119179187 n=1 Tax=Rhipicephalus microplus TaxID=6941 RepID=UPI003F6B9665
MLSAGNSVSANGRGSSTPFHDEDSSYKVVLPRLPTGNDVLNSVFLHADLSGRPYRAPDFRDALLKVVSTADIIGVGQYQMSHVWMVTCANSMAKQKLVTCGELRVKGLKCMVLDPETKNIRLKLLWLPPHLESRRVEEAFQAYGVVKSVEREAWRCAGMEQWMTTNRDVALELKDTITVSSIPHLMSIYGHQCLVLIPGRPPLCLRCKRVGHVRRQCKTPRCLQCQRFGHSSDACVSTYANKLRSGQGTEDQRLDHLMDVTEVVDATGEAAGGAEGALKEAEHLSMDTLGTQNKTANDAIESINECNAADEHHLEGLKDKPPDNEEQEGMDCSQTRKRQASVTDEATTSAPDTTEQVSSCGPRVTFFGDRETRRLCQSPEESAAKKCKGGPHPPDKPLPDESEFADYLSPPPPVSPYGLSYYRPLPPTRGYYGPPPMQIYPAPMQGYYAPSYYPPPPPPVMPRPPLIQPYNRPFLGRYRVVHAPTYGQQEQPFVSTFLYGALVIVSVVLFTLLIATVFAVTGNAGRRSQRRQHRTGVDLVRYSTLPDRHFRFLSSGPQNAGIEAPDHAQGVLFRKHVEKDDVQDAK